MGSTSENLLDAIIGLPPNLFYGTGIPAAVLIFRRNKADNTVLFIDASRDFEPGPNQNRLRNGDLERMASTYRARLAHPRYSYVATMDEIKSNDFNLNIARYVDTFEEEEDIDLTAVQAEINMIEEQLVPVQQQLKAYLRELGL